jgi:hypothetical protein
MSQPSVPSVSIRVERTFFGYNIVTPFDRLAIEDDDLPLLISELIFWLNPDVNPEAVRRLAKLLTTGDLSPISSKENG